MGLIGTPILTTTDDDLQGLALAGDLARPRSGDERWKQLAQAALASQSASDSLARQEVNAYKEEYGDGVSTLVRIFNASGCTLRFIEDKHSSGRWDKYHPDGMIQNGQWSVCLHVKKSGGATGSCAAMRYKVESEPFNAARVLDELIIGWDTPYAGFNSGYATVAGIGPVAGGAAAVTAAGVELADIWKRIHDLADNDSDSNGWSTHGASAPLAARYQTGQNSSPMFTVVIGRTDV